MVRRPVCNVVPARPEVLSGMFLRYSRYWWAFVFLCGMGTSVTLSAVHHPDL